MASFKLHHWPALTFAWFALTFIVSYLVAVLGSGNVYYFWPMISDTGALPPESCIFGQMLNMAAVFMFITMYIRYRQVQFAIETGIIELGPKWNKWSMGVGVAGCLGMSLVANFQETSIVAVHGIGAILAFAVGSVYFMIEAKISYAFKDPSVVGITKSIIYMRIVEGIILLPIFIVCFTFVALANAEFKGDSIQWWTEEDGAFEYRLAGSFLEWIMAILMIIFVISYTNEFKTLEFEQVNFKCRFPDLNNARNEENGKSNVANNL